MVYDLPEAHGDAASSLAHERIGVLVVNLGTPDSPTYFAVQRYLREFLSDRRVIKTSRLIWLPLLYGVVLPFRPVKTARKYRKIWMRDGSPLAVYSTRLAAKIGALLQSRFDNQVRVGLGMTYGNPSLADTIRSLLEQNIKKLVVLPLYPQYCSSTTGSVVDGTRRALRQRSWQPETRFIDGYYDDAGYIASLTASIQKHWAEVGARSHLIFSYHGIPAAYVADGDPYQAQAEATTRSVVSRLGLADEEWSHCYQSRFGRVVWLQPYTEDTLRLLAKRGVRQVTVVSPSFAVDCLETLEEVAMEYRQKFLDMGGERLTLVPALNDGDRHAEVLADIVAKNLQGWI
jgi:protoporphyrin/coproporphyrin ferrochelatase